MQKKFEPTSAHNGSEPRLPIGYARVSTVDQDLGLQIVALTQDGVAEPNIYRETISGASKARPEFTRMMRELRPGDVVTVWKLDRLSSSLPALLKTVDEIHRQGAHLRVLTQQIDTSTASGRMFLNMLGVIAEFERDLGVERTQAGLERARARGKVLGRRPTYTDEQIREAMANYMLYGSWKRAAALVRQGRKIISIPNLQRRFRELKRKDTDAERRIE